MKQKMFCLMSILFALSLLVCLAITPAYAAVETGDREVAEWVSYGGLGLTPLDNLILPGCAPVGISIDDPDKVLENIYVQRQGNGSGFLLSYAVVNDAGKAGRTASISIAVRVTEAYTRDYQIRVTVHVNGQAPAGSPAGQPGPAKPAPGQPGTPAVQFSGQTGWVQKGNDWYYFNSDGTMATGWVKTNGKWYYTDAGGKRVTGWVLVGEKWYYLDQNGIMATGWLQDRSKWYYLNSSGANGTGWIPPQAPGKPAGSRLIKSGITWTRTESWLQAGCRINRNGISWITAAQWLPDGWIPMANGTGWILPAP